MVYVINKQGQALMPTERFGKVRRLLKNSLAHVVCRIPFTIQLDYDTTDYTQPVSLGVDAGSKHIGISATTSDKELYAADVELRNDIVDKLSTRRELRRTRRSRLRYRKARFNNRVSSKRKGWLAPSVENKIQTHLTVVEKIHKFLPITNIVVETTSFDIQKINNPSISGSEYQQGEQLDFFNVREYVLFRDNHICQHCKGKSKDKVLNVHHIESRKTGGDSPKNLITLCETCHKAYHRGEFKLNIKRGKSFRDSAFMGIMRWSLYDRLKNIYPNVSMTFGYNSIEWGRCEICGKETQLERTYFYYPIHCECCGNKENRHFEMIRHCKKCPAPMPKEIHPLCKAMDGKTYHASVSNMLPIDIHGEFIINERIIKEE